jgi:hypothetical protein
MLILVHHFYGRREQKTYREEIKYLDKLNTSNYFFREKVMNYRKLLGALVTTIAFFAFGAQANAALLLTLENPAATNYQQTSNTPCIIGDPSCKAGKALLEFTLIPSGPDNPYPLSSPEYKFSDIQAVVGNVFFVGIDLNTTGGSNVTETLKYFNMTVGGIVAYYYSTETLLAQLNQGNGYADVLLIGFNLTGLDSTKLIQFNVDMASTSAGREQFFLIADRGGVIGEIPEPGTTAILGLGLLGMGFISLRGKKKQS